MPTNFSGRDKAGRVSLALLGSLVMILAVLFSSFNNNVEAQNQPKEEKLFMNASGKKIPPLDLQVPAVTETASFALG